LHFLLVPINSPKLSYNKLMNWLQNISVKKTIVIIIVILAIHAAILLAMGQVPICECGFVKFWHGATGTSEGSQHISDWYTFSHIIHGFVFYFILWLINKKLKLNWKWLLLIAILVEMGWEIFENTDYIINRYREVTISLDYYGDSVINSVSDICWMILGFIAARKFPIWLSVLLIIAMEAFVGYYIRDNLTLNIIMLIYPLDAIRQWQMGA
jgi:hypothetical protein